MATVLIVEDEREIREVLRRYLERAGITVMSTGSGAEALTLITSSDLDAVVLDLGLPDVDGNDILQEIHRHGSLRVLVLTARSSTEDRIHGLESGADDYVTKPFSPREVTLRVQKLLDRTAVNGHASIASFGSGRLVIDEDQRTTSLDDSTVDLTPTEWGILTSLCHHPGRAYSRYELVNRVRGYEFAGYERTIDSHIKNLRHKLGDAGTEMIETVLGVGYRFGWPRDV